MRFVSPILLPTSPLKGEESSALAAGLAGVFDPHRSRMQAYGKPRGPRAAGGRSA